MSVTLEFRYTSSDWREAQKITLKHLRRHRVDLRMTQVLTWVVLVGVALALAYRVVSTAATLIAASTKQPAGAPGAISPFEQAAESLGPWPIIVPVVGFMLWWRLRKSRQVPASLDNTHIMSADDNGVIWTYPTLRSEYRWHAFHGFAETANLFVLFQDDARKVKWIRVLIIPKRAFPMAGMLAEFQGLLAAHARPHASAFPVLPPLPKAPDRFTDRP